MKLRYMIAACGLMLATAGIAHGGIIPTDCGKYAEIAVRIATARQQGITESQVVEYFDTPKDYTVSAMFYNLVGEIFNSQLTPEQARAAAYTQCMMPDAMPPVVDDTPTPPNALAIPSNGESQ